MLELLLAFFLAHGEADWIMRGEYTSPEGVHCCGPDDCKRLPIESLEYTKDGFSVNTGDITWLIPYGTEHSSETKEPWLCLKGDKTPRCLFVPKLIG